MACPCGGPRQHESRGGSVSVQRDAREWALRARRGVGAFFAGSLGFRDDAFGARAARRQSRRSRQHVLRHVGRRIGTERGWWGPGRGSIPHCKRPLGSRWAADPYEASSSTKLVPRGFLQPRRCVPDEAWPRYHPATFDVGCLRRARGPSFPGTRNEGRRGSGRDSYQERSCRSWWSATRRMLRRVARRVVEIARVASSSRNQLGGSSSTRVGDVPLLRAPDPSGACEHRAVGEGHRDSRAPTSRPYSASAPL